MEILHRTQDFFVIQSGNDAGCNMTLVADLTDSADGFQVKGIFISFPVRRGENDSNTSDGLYRRFILRGRNLVSQLVNDFLYTFLCFFADRCMVVAHTGNRRRGDSGTFCDIFNGYWHSDHPLLHKVAL